MSQGEEPLRADPGGAGGEPHAVLCHPRTALRAAAHRAQQGTLAPPHHFGTQIGRPILRHKSDTSFGRYMAAGFWRACSGTDLATRDFETGHFWGLNIREEHGEIF